MTSNHHLSLNQSIINRHTTPITHYYLTGTSSNEDAANNFVPFDDGITELTPMVPAAAAAAAVRTISEDGGGSSPRVSVDGVVDAPALTGADRARLTSRDRGGEGMDRLRGVDGMGQLPGLPEDGAATAGSNQTATTTTTKKKKKMNLVIPPYRSSGGNRNTNRGYLKPPISPYNPAGLATSLKTGVNDRFKLYSAHCAGLVKGWAVSVLIVVAVPVLVAILAV
jgi:hypothetical protein